MTYLPSLPRHARLLDVFRAFPDTSLPLLDYHETLMRGPSPLTVAQRELIAAYVSGLNGCGYCYGVHQQTARAFGVGADMLVALLDDLETAPVDAPMRTLLRYVRALATSPARVVPEDAATVLAAGWDERALHDAVSVCALFSFMNRYVDGLGVSADETYQELSGRRLADGGYAGLKSLVADDD
jgi:uncharacterized peroxidase-related enzyme